MRKIISLIVICFVIASCNQYITSESFANPKTRFERNLKKTKRAQRSQVKCAPSDKIIYH